jgi:predicted TIM-barrel fold metal-dependent hydrolase
MKFDSRLVETVNKIAIVDTHEHLELEEFRPKRDLWDLFFHHYSTTDLLSCGMPYASLYPIHDNNVAMEEKWKLISPYWPCAKLTAYGRTLRIAARDIYGVPDINDDTVGELMAAFRRENKPGLYEKVLGKSGLLVSIQDSGPRIDDPRYFVNVDRLDRFTGVRCIEDLKQLKDYGGWDINTVDDLEVAMNQFFAAAVKRNVVGIKCCLAYYQPLDFPMATKEQAQQDLEIIKKTSFPYEMQLMVPHGKENRHLVNYLIRKALKLVGDAGLPFVIHTGYLEGIGNPVSNANPQRLSSLIKEFPNVRWVLYHAGYPYWREAGIMAKTNANVYVDMCFVHVLSQEIYKRALSEYLELVPPAKIFAFGADYKIIEGTYVQQKLTRASIIEVLQEKIDSGFYSFDEACFVADRILRQNAVEFYNLNTHPAVAQKLAR